MATETAGQVFEEGKEAASAGLDKATEKEREALNVVDKVQEAIGKVTPVVTKFDRLAAPADLKSRLDWGEPALSILDVRDRDAFNFERITGAMPMPIESLVEKAQTSFESSRNLYVYGDSNEYAVEAATQLQTAGFNKVSVIEGGLSAWKAIGGSTEGQTTGANRGQKLP